MRAADAWAIERERIPSLELMELAGQAIARAALEPAPEGAILIVCGKGNNSGDGLVAARLLRENRDRLGDKQVVVMLLADPAELSPDATANLKRLPGDPPHAFDAGLIAQAGVIVDAMLGTGASGAPGGVLAEAVTAINRRSSVARVIAVDNPTGVDASTGQVAGDAVFAELTISLHAPKVGQFVAPGSFHCGEVRVADIGIPPESFEGANVAPAAGTIGPRVLRLAPRRDDASSKFSSGVLGVVGGSTGLTGAPCMSAMAAQRTGAGYVTVYVPSSLNLVFEQRLLEAMSVPLDDEDGAILEGALDTLIERSERCDALVVGPGIGRAAGTGRLVASLLAGSDKPALLDADGLYPFSGAVESLRREAPLLITPHTGELARLLGVSSDDVEGARLERAQEAAERSGAVVILKGSDTVVAAPGQSPLINTLKAPGLATAGTGDVLSGIAGAYLAMGLGAREAACAAVYAHALAGREASERRGADHMIASDVISLLPAVLA
ncbi:MAG: NAD(P)H-hydrate dehydratase [Thermoleophilaceae bacterium]|nr:NAD(P)H-hydrate dehydratase [Thermoleophilaceae bacterium]